jgi:hypothetical protein
MYAVDENVRRFIYQEFFNITFGENKKKYERSVNCSSTRRKLYHMINPEVYQGAVVFQLYYRLGDVVVERGDQ